jgi:hypothetical protein
MTPEPRSVEEAAWAEIRKALGVAAERPRIALALRAIEEDLAELTRLRGIEEAALRADDAFENWRNAPDGEASEYAVEEVMAKLVNLRIALTRPDRQEEGDG